MIISATIREGIDTPIDLALLDNKFLNKKEAILGIIRGNLKYQKLIFNIYPKIACNLGDKDFDKTLSLIQDFKRKDFMREGNKPYSITYKIACALSNTHHIEYFSHRIILIYLYYFKILEEFVLQKILPYISRMISY